MFPVESVRWGGLQPYRGQYDIVVSSLCRSKESCLLCQIAQRHCALGSQPAAFLQFPVEEASPLFILTSYSLALLMPLPQVA